MTPKLAIVPRAAMPPSETSAAAVLALCAEPQCTPAWWLADREDFDALVDTRARIHRLEKAAATRALSILGAVLLAAVSIYSVDATGAMDIPAAPGLLVIFIAVAPPCMLAWLVDRRLVQQLNDINLRSQLWLHLVNAVKRGCIDIARLESPPPLETEIERLLRREAAVAARFIRSGTSLTPHVPVFGRCFTLENA